MMYWNGDLSWWGWLIMSVAMVAFWAIVIGGAVYLARGRGERGEEDERRPGPEEILAERLARGEIEADEYRERRAALRGTEPRAQARG